MDTGPWLVPLDGTGTPRPLIVTESNEGRAQVSPDGKWLAFISDRSGRPEAYVRRLEGGRVVQASTGGAFAFLWSRDGSELILRAQDNSRVAVPIAVAGTEVVPGKPHLLFTSIGPRSFLVADTEKGLLGVTEPDPGDSVVPVYFDSAPMSKH